MLADGPSGQARGPRHAAPPESTRSSGASRARRSPWTRPRDRVAAATLTVVCLVAGVLVWTFSDSRATSHDTAPPPPALPPAPASVPATLSEAWRAPSAATHVPVAEGPAAVTASGGEVAGRDPLSGDVRWRYSRELPLCTVAGAGSKVLAVYRKDTGCSEVTQFDPATGRRTAQRNSDADFGTLLLAAGGHVTATGTNLLNTWRDDLVLSMEYGDVYARVNPERQPRPECRYSSVAVTTARVGVIERCPDEDGDRLTVLKAAPEESDSPEAEYSVRLPGDTGTLVAMSGDSGGRAAVALPGRGELVVYDAEGKPAATYPLDVPDTELSATPPGLVVPTSTGRENIYWYTGSRTVALSRTTLAPQWTLKNTYGPGTVFAGQLVVPIEGGLAVLDERTGDTSRTVAVDRGGYAGSVRLDTAGPVLLEQRGDTLVALR